jgi:TRAP-type mannitol/chloroaromatic compound transport system permease large subunit
LALPTMLRRGYDPAVSAGTISAAGTLGQIIPPSIVLILLGDVLSTAYQRAQLQQGIFAPDTISVGDLFAGALFPGLMLVGMYLVYLIVVSALRPAATPAVPAEEIEAATGGRVWRHLLAALVPPVILIVAVLGSILGGVATPTEAASVGAVGAMFLAGHHLRPERPWPILIGAGCLVGLLALTAGYDLRLRRAVISPTEWAAILLAGLFTLGAAWGLVVALWRGFSRGILQEVVYSAAQLTAMVFMILIGAALFTVVFRGLGGDETVQGFLEAMPGGVLGAMIVVMAAMFVLGFFLDFIEITLVIVPIVAPALILMGVDPIWLGIMMAINLQTSFLTPPFGFALFYLRGVAPPKVRTIDIYQGVTPFIAIQLFALVVLAVFPALATWLPSVLYGPGAR